jgi:hypothetical protein
MKNTQKNNINIKKDEKSAKSPSINQQLNSDGKKSLEKNEKEGKNIDTNKEKIVISPVEQANIFLFLEFFENLNENNLEKCQEILTTSNQLI